MKYPLIINTIASTPWISEPSVPRAILEAINLHLRAQVSIPTQIQGGSEPKAQSATITAEDRAGYRSEGIAIHPVEGIIGKHLSSFDTMCGGFDIDDLRQMVLEAERDPNVDQHLIFFNTPGGTVTGVPETAELITSLSKPVIGYTECLAASAGQWLAAACDLFYMAPSARAASVGTYMAIIDASKAFEKEGFKLELFAAGKHKAAGIYGSSLSKEQAEFFKNNIQSINEEFKSFVTQQRPGVKQDALEGQALYGSDCIDAGLADEMIPSIDDVLEMMLA